MSPPSPPPPPNPYAVAAAQTASNVETAIANTMLTNADEDTPQGTLRNTVRGTYPMVIPLKDSDGNPIGTETRQIPLIKRVTALTPKSQSIFDKDQDTKIEMTDWALQQAVRMKSVHSTPFTLAGLPATPIAPAPQAITSTLAAPSVIRMGLTGSAASATAIRDRALAELSTRTDFLMNRDEQTLIVKLANQGIFPGTVAYMRELEVFYQGRNDARTRDYLAAGQEGSRLFAIEMQVAQFANHAQQQSFGQILAMAEFANKGALQRYEMLHRAADFAATMRERGVQERVLERNQPVNEITTILHGGQIQMPQFTPFKAGHINDTPVGQYVYQTAALKQDAWKMEVQSQQQMMGGMMGLLGNIMSMPGMGM